MRLVPVTLDEAKKFVGQFHRHNRAPISWKFGVGLTGRDGELVGVAMAGRCVARGLDAKENIEITRVCVRDTPNGNSGTARYAYWRSLSSTGEWTPITLPADWTANCVAAKSRAIANDEIVGLAGYPMVRQARSFYLIT